MGTGTLNLVYRPIKIGHSVNPTDSQALQNAIEINSYLWGGAYNPLIPHLTRVSKHWTQPHRRIVSGKDITKAILQNFDPDFLVGKKEDEYHAETFRGTITRDQFWKRLEEHRRPLLGVGIYDLTESLIRSELKYQRNVPLTFKIPRFGKKHGLFLSSVFGALPKSVLDD